MRGDAFAAILRPPAILVGTVAVSPPVPLFAQDGESDRSAARGPEVAELASGARAVLQAVSAVSESVVWIGGHDGVVARTVDGGSAWELLPGPGGDTLQFRDIHGFSAEAAVAMSAGEGSLSRIYLTSDGGGEWTLAFLMTEPAGFLDCLDFWDERRGFAYGDSFDGIPYILVTQDGGRSWERVPGDATPAAADGEGGFAASGTCARAGPEGTGWIGTGAGGSARLLTTGDHGRSWRAAELPIARGELAGVFTLAVAEGALLMALGGDLDRRDSVVADNAAKTVGGHVRWESAAPAPIEGAVYGSDAGCLGGEWWVVAVAPTGAAYAVAPEDRWTPLPGVVAWAVDFAPGGRVGWAAGSGGRIWRLRW